jgi:hypothetical protein
VLQLLPVLVLVLVEEVAVVEMEQVHSRTYHQVVAELPLPCFNKRKHRDLLADLVTF